MKKIFPYSIFILIILILLSVSYYKFANSKNDSNSWVGSYTFYEFVPPNQPMDYSIDIYEERGLYAYIKREGWQTFSREKTKVWNHGDEIMFVFCDDYIDEEGNISLGPWHEKGEVLLKFKRQDEVILTEWGEIRPLLIKHEETGQYFTKVLE